MDFIEYIKAPWPWYVAGPLIGLTVPALLVLGNKTFGVSSTLRHICAICAPAGIPFFSYNWKKEIWNLVFVIGIFLGGWLSFAFLADPAPLHISPVLRAELGHYGMHHFGQLMPDELFSWKSLFTLRGFLLMVAGGFLVGFGTRYAGGCTSGHSIMGLANLQWPSLVATLCFMAGGFLVSNLVLPYILQL